MIPFDSILSRIIKSSNVQSYQIYLIPEQLYYLYNDLTYLQ